MGGRQENRKAERLCAELRSPLEMVQSLEDVVSGMASLRASDVWQK